MKEKKPANAGGKQGNRFQPGTSGNPSGKRKGTRHKATRLAMDLLDGEIEALVRVAVALALTGDMAALSLCIGRLIPPAKDHAIDCRLPKVQSIADLPALTGAILAAVAAGRIGATEAEKLSRIVSAHRESIELIDINIRLLAIEKRLEK